MVDGSVAYAYQVGLAACFWVRQHLHVWSLSPFPALQILACSQ